MDKFSKLETKKVQPTTSTLYDGESLKVVNYKNWEIVTEPNNVIILPYLRDEGYILLRHEPIPTYQYFYDSIPEYKGISHFLTCVSGTVEKDESLNNAVRRELFEETGIVLSSLYDIELEKSLFKSKGVCSIYYIYILEIRYNDYRITQPKGDGSQEDKQSKVIQISLGDLNDIKPHDLITDYVLTKFKSKYNIK